MKQERKRSFSVTALRTDLYRENQNLIDFIDRHVPKEDIHEGMILAITSKIVSLAEKRVVEKSTENKTDLIKKEAQYFLGKTAYNCHLTIHHGLLLPAAGIDESNCDGDKYILLPISPYDSAQKLHQDLSAKWKLKNLGILLTDSHTSPLRRGVTGIALAHWGFAAITDKKDSPDLFNRLITMTAINNVDALSSAAVWCMGETDESRPLAVISGADVQWTTSSSAKEVQISPEEDLYSPLLADFIKPS